MLILFPSWTALRHDTNGLNANQGTLGRCMIEFLGDERVMELLNEYRQLYDRDSLSDNLLSYKLSFRVNSLGYIFDCLPNSHSLSTAGYTRNECDLIINKLKNDSIILWSCNSIPMDSLMISSEDNYSKKYGALFTIRVSPFNFMPNYLSEYQGFLKDNKLKDNEISYYLFYRRKLESFVNLPLDSCTVAWGMMDDFPYERYYKPIPDIKINNKRDKPIDYIKQKIYEVVFRIAELMKYL